MTTLSMAFLSLHSVSELSPGSLAVLYCHFRADKLHRQPHRTRGSLVLSRCSASSGTMADGPRVTSFQNPCPAPDASTAEAS